MVIRYMFITATFGRSRYEFYVIINLCLAVICTIQAWDQAYQALISSPSTLIEVL